VWGASRSVKAKGGTAGVDKESIEDIEFHNLYHIWNRMPSDSYFPLPVKAVPIPKKSGGTRILGVPTISDRIAQAEWAMKRIAGRFKECGFEIHPEKSRIVYCKDKNRREAHEAVSFEFLGFTFRPRRCVSEYHGIHANFLPAFSCTSMKAMNREILSWHIQLKNDKSFKDLSNMFNIKLKGWLGYFGRFYPSELRRIWRNLN
jgi:RNA-directed DNA polymerase